MAKKKVVKKKEIEHKENDSRAHVGVVLLAIAILVVVLVIYLMQAKKLFQFEQVVAELQSEMVVQKDEVVVVEEEVVEEISFDGCGLVTRYEGMGWYMELEEVAEEEMYVDFRSMTKEGTVINRDAELVGLEDVVDSCYSANGNILVMLVPGDYAQAPSVFKFDTEEGVLERALMNDHGRGMLASGGEFGKRVDDVIKMEGMTGDAGVVALMYYDYNFIENVIELKKEYVYEADDKEGGRWIEY